MMFNFWSLLWVFEDLFRDLVMAFLAPSYDRGSTLVLGRVFYLILDHGFKS
ncbi:unknown protein [Microcystis aeruginosa NIES-843]|uniref:Uncharacterized protein n=1 Tax=Microcystis aeruginosa (strain NIES-843 / IAM M-2473) TaxID=449447 RepID=B0JPA5_MICAN|nr:unknown protein [Microcystis aeruginosa NIES-843]